MTDPLVITGLGMVSPLGIGPDAFAAGVSAPDRPDVFQAPTTFDGKAYPGAQVAEVRGFDAAAWLGDKGLRNNDRLTRLLLVATRLALQHAGIKSAGAFTALSAASVGVCAATAYGSLEAITELNRVATLEDPRYLNPARFPNTVINSALGYVSIWEDLRALNVTVTNGTPGPLDAVFCAGTYLSAGRARAVVVGGAEAMSEALFLAFHRMGLLDAGHAGWAPGAEGSTGMRLGEAASLLVLETAAGARARGQKALAHVLGYGTAFDAPTRPGQILAPSAASLSRAIQGALADAGVTAEDIDVVASGLGGHHPLDAVELAALQDSVPGACVAAPKVRTGEAVGASAATALAAATAWVTGAPLQDVVRGRRPEAVRTVLVPALGFYGNASALVVRRPE